MEVSGNLSSVYSPHDDIWGTAPSRDEVNWNMANLEALENASKLRMLLVDNYGA